MNKLKMQRFADELTEEMAETVVSKPRCKEVLAGALVASAQILVLSATRLTKDQEQSTEIIALAISKSYELLHQAEEQIKKGGISE